MGSQENAPIPIHSLLQAKEHKPSTVLSRQIGYLWTAFLFPLTLLSLVNKSQSNLPIPFWFTTRPHQGLMLLAEKTYSIQVSGVMFSYTKYQVIN